MNRFRWRGCNIVVVEFPGTTLCGYVGMNGFVGGRSSLSSSIAGSWYHLHGYGRLGVGWKVRVQVHVVSEGERENGCSQGDGYGDDKRKTVSILFLLGDVARRTLFVTSPGLCQVML